LGFFQVAEEPDFDTFYVFKEKKATETFQYVSHSETVLSPYTTATVSLLKLKVQWAAHLCRI
jgi:hypothetical protein